MHDDYQVFSVSMWERTATTPSRAADLTAGLNDLTHRLTSAPSET